MVDTENPPAATEQKHAAMTEEELIEAANKIKQESWLGYFFPILPAEVKRVRLFACMFCIISFVYAFLRVFKDRIVNSVLENTDTKNWLKLLTFIVTQALVIFCQNISSKTNFNNAFKTLTMYFSGFLIINAFLMKFSYYLQPNDIFSDLLFVSDTLTMRGLNGFYPLLLVVNQFFYSAFYILAEVIGSMMVSFCFMTYVNNNTSENQNKRFVRTLLFFSNISSLLAGFSVKFWSDSYSSSPKSSIDKFYLIFPFSAVALYSLVLFLKKKVEEELLNVIVVPSGAPKKAGSKKKKIGLRDSIYLMVSSKLLLSMCAVAFFYNFSANLLETAHSSGIFASANLLGEEKSFFASGFKSMDLICTSIITCIIIISPISLLPDRFGIFFFAAVPLGVSLIASWVELYFSLVNYPATGSENMGIFSSFDPITKRPYAEAVAGTVIQCCIKIAKYAFFDIVKELVAMKIDPSIRPLYKGVFDGSITKLGKSMGSFYGIGMLMITGAQDARYYFPVTATFMFVLCMLWFLPINYLSKSFKKAKESGTFMDPGISSASDIKI